MWDIGLTVGTRVAAAFVNFLLTVGAHVTDRTAAGVAPGRVVDNASPPVEAGPIGAGHGADLAVLAVKALRACAHVVVH